MHARAVVALDRLWHEGRRLAVLVRDVVHDVFVDLHVVGGAHQGVKFSPQLGLAWRHLMVVLFDREPHIVHHRKHFGPEIALAMERRHREKAALYSREYVRTY